MMFVAFGLFVMVNCTMIFVTDLRELLGGARISDGRLRMSCWGWSPDVNTKNQYKRHKAWNWSLAGDAAFKGPWIKWAPFFFFFFLYVKCTCDPFPWYMLIITFLPLKPWVPSSLAPGHTVSCASLCTSWYAYCLHLPLFIYAFHPQACPHAFPCTFFVILFPRFRRIYEAPPRKISTRSSIIITIEIDFSLL